MKTNNIFKKGSKTFYTASRFFPKEIRQDVSILYAFVRVADDYVDQIPQDKSGFLNYRKLTNQAFRAGSSTNNIINDFVILSKKYKFEKKWVDTFLDAMESDIHKKKYNTYKELENYMYGSAEVIGLMMARILKLPKKADSAARLQGKAMQLINFIRDIKEDLTLKRQYIPQEDLRRFGIKSLTNNINEQSFKKLVEFQIERYRQIQNDASKGFKYIPFIKRIPITTAASIYEWTANKIEENPQIVFKQKIKPSKERVKLEYIKKTLHI